MCASGRTIGMVVLQRLQRPSQWPRSQNQRVLISRPTPLITPHSHTTECRGALARDETPSRLDITTPNCVHLRIAAGPSYTHLHTIKSVTITSCYKDSIIVTPLKHPNELQCHHFCRSYSEKFNCLLNTYFVCFNNFMAEFW